MDLRPHLISKARVLKTGDVPAAVVLAPSSGKGMLLALVAKSVGVAGSSLGAPDGGLRLRRRGKSLEIATGKAAASLNGKALAKNSAHLITGSNTLKLGSKTMKLDALDASAVAQKLTQPGAKSQTFCGTPEY